MLFSLITVTLNAEKFLDQTLRSVAHQECTDFEHIIWDGGSRDKTIEIARSFPHAQIYNGRDRGISDAMNQAARLATGKFLVYLHGDDFLPHPRALSIVKNALKQHPEAEWLYGRAAIIDAEGKQLNVTPYEPYTFRRLRKYNFITHPACYVARELFWQVGGFDTKFRYCMDYDLWLRLAARTTPLPLSAILATFRQHKNSLSTSEPLAVAHEAYAVRNGYVKNFFERFLSYKTWKARLKSL